MKSQCAPRRLTPDAVVLFQQTIKTGEFRLPQSDRGDIGLTRFARLIVWLHMMSNASSSHKSSKSPQIARNSLAREERSVTIDGVTWRYWFAGSGPPLLLIHGFLGFSFSWRFNMEALSRAFFRLRHGSAGMRILGAPDRQRIARSPATRKVCCASWNSSASRTPTSWARRAAAG